MINSGCSNLTGICGALSPGNPDPQTVQIAQGSTHQFEWAEADEGLSSTTANTDNLLDPFLGVLFVNDSPNGSVSAFSDNHLAGRCDTIVSTTDGCVNENNIPILTYNAILNPLVKPVAQHIFDAQQPPSNGGLAVSWGVPSYVRSTGQVLTRDMSSADQAANNRAACAGVPTVTGCQALMSFRLSPPARERRSSPCGPLSRCQSPPTTHRAGSPHLLQKQPRDR